MTQPADVILSIAKIIVLFLVVRLALFTFATILVGFKYWQAWLFVILEIIVIAAILYGLTLL